MDQRRLMVWVMTNWLVIQGLRKYKLHQTADSLAGQIFNALLRNWREHCALSETLSGICALAPMESANAASNGCWAGFQLYLKEACRGGQRGGARTRRKASFREF